MKILYIAVLLLFAQIFPVFSQSTIKEDELSLILENTHILLEFHKDKGYCSIYDKDRELTVIDRSYFAADGWNFHSKKIAGIRYECTPTSYTEKAGKGKAVIISAIHTEGKALPEYKWKISLPDNGKYLLFNMGIKNTLANVCRFTRAHALSDALLFPGKDIKKVLTLNGAAGRDMAAVSDDISREAENSMLLTCLVEGKRYSLVWGGMKYAEYYAITGYDKEKRAISLEMNDPTGKRIETGKEWWSTDSYYIGIAEENPFYALENYALLLREYNHAQPHSYNFPTLCGWGVGHLSHGKNVNNSVDLVGEADGAKQCGLSGYTQIAIRLEPDRYCYIDGNTEQGWWDDMHWSKYGHLQKPYDTFAKWCREIRKRNALPFTYFQCSMPSDDFARKYPEWMLGNEEILTKLHLYHNHHQPYVRYDYTDKGFQEHMKKVWKRLEAAGIQGIKFDYPESAWNIYGGFDDLSATTSSAYRTVFQLAREGLGKDSRLTERNLGESGAPCLDITAGIIDLQRVTADNNKFDPKHISTVGLRWYKARTVFNYYTDSKNLLTLTPAQRKSLITMTALTSGMLELSTSFWQLTPEMVYEISRMYPVYDGIKSPRPIDAFTGIRYPQIYDLELEKGWHQLALFNSDSVSREITVRFGDEMIKGGLELDPDKKYYLYDFWNRSLKGVFKGDSLLTNVLGPLECCLYSLKEVLDIPQIIHTDRHIMQGWTDTRDVRWEASRKELTGKSLTAAGEDYQMVIALNSLKKIRNLHSGNGKIKIQEYSKDGEYATITIQSGASGQKEISWSITFR